MAIGRVLLTAAFVLLLSIDVRNVFAIELIPPAAEMKTDRPRILIRPRPTSYAISLEELRSGATIDESATLLRQLASQRHAGGQALVWLINGDENAAEKALTRLRAYRYPGGRVDTFHVFFRLTEFAMAYDWLYDYPGFTPDIRAEVRSAMQPLVQHGLNIIDDHMFHNYVWMSAGGLALWSIATSGEDDESTLLFERIRKRFNRGLFPAWKYLDGLPSEPMGYWALYVFTPGALTLLANQSAFEVDLVNRVKSDDGDWLERHFDNLVHSTLPDMRYLPWGDLQSGPNGGVTRDMAGIMDALTWALRSPYGTHFSQWLKQQRGSARFARETAILSILYTPRLPTERAEPPLSFFAGNHTGGHFIARDSWKDDATFVALTCTDHFGDHHHLDQGSFIIYRNGLLAIDPPVYRRVRGPQQKTENHNTLLLGGKAQRPVRGQWFGTIDAFKENLNAGHMLETGEVLFQVDQNDWAAVACEFAQSYDTDTVESCVRQLLFIRPDTVLVMDHLKAKAGESVPPIEWLIHLPDATTVSQDAVWATNGKSWIRCRSVIAESSPTAIPVPEVRTQRVNFRYPGESSVSLVHLLEIGDGSEPRENRIKVTARRSDSDIQITVGNRTFKCLRSDPFTVSDVAASSRGD